MKKLSCILTVSLLLLIAVPALQAFANEADDLMRDVKKPEKISLEGSKNGIVEIQSGTQDDRGKFNKKMQGCGLLVSNSNDGVYIVTARHIAHASDSQGELVVKINVRGDVTAELNVVAESKAQDFCILSADNVISRKMPVCFDNDKDIKDGSIIYSLGFKASKETKGSLKYDAEDASVNSGKVKAGKTVKNNNYYIEHDAVVDKNNDGGALLNEQGYVIGMNNVKMNSNGHSYGTTTTDIKKILDNENIAYQSKETNDLYRNVYESCEEDIDKIYSSDYDGDARSAAKIAVEYATSILKEKPYDLEELKKAEKTLKDAEKDLKKKTSKTTYVIIILGFILLIVLIRFIRLFRWRRKTVMPEKKDIPEKEANYKRAKDEKVFVQNSQTAQQVTEVPTDINKVNKAAEVKKPNIKLRWKRNDMIIPVIGNEFIIGKKREITDFCIEDNPAVSRSHACLRWERERLMIYDLNSVNGTYVNGERIDVSELNSGDLIRLANEEFIVEKME